MEFEFDKEMDALLRQATRSGEIRVNELPGAHLDADEISIFAENALSEKAKPRVINHLADCDRCRTILSNTIILNSEAGEESVPIAVSGEQVAIAAILNVPWYKKLFGTRNLAYGLGALVVIFAGMFGFLIVQRSLNSGAMDMAKVSEDSANTAAAPSDAKSAPSREATNSNLASDSEAESLDESKSDSNSSGDTAKNTADPLGGPRSAEEDGADKDSAPEGYSDRRQPGTLGKVSAEKQKVGNRQTGGDRSDRPQDDENKLSDNDGKASETRERDVVASRSAPPPAPKATPAPSTVAKGNTAKKREEQTQAGSSADSVTAVENAKENNSRSVGGKEFTLKDRVWYDSQYKGQKTTNVRRKSNSYKKLDSGLRSITDKLSGTVVLVWKSKAYRIN